MAKQDVLGMGRPYTDLLLVLDHLPHADEVLPVQQVDQQGGGPVPTALVTVSRLGATASIWGLVGGDQYGQSNLAEFQRYGVDTRYLRVVPGADSPMSVILIDRSTGTRAILSHRGKTPAPECRPVAPDVLAGFRVLHLSGSYTDAEIETARSAQGLGVIVSLDGGSGLFKPQMDELIALTDVLVAARLFAQEATGRGTPAECAQELLRMGPRVVVITDGAAGSWGWTGNGVDHVQPAFPVTVADTTGAGDVYHGAFVYGFVQGWELACSMRFAAATAALKCTRVGGRAGIPTLPEVERFLAEARGSISENA